MPWVQSAHMSLSSEHGWLKCHWDLKFERSQISSSQPFKSTLITLHIELGFTLVLALSCNLRLCAPSCTVDDSGTLMEYIFLLKEYSGFSTSFRSLVSQQHVWHNVDFYNNNNNKKKLKGNFHCMWMHLTQVRTVNADFYLFIL